MHAAVLWFGFLGAWLLFSGPVYQAALELEAEEDARTRLVTLSTSVEEPPPVSPWWWLLPPVRLVLARRRRDRWQHAVLETISAEDLALITRYFAIARGWIFVAAGAWLIALKETYELLEHLHLEVGAWLLVVVVMTLLGVGFTVQSAVRKRRLLGRASG